MVHVHVYVSIVLLFMAFSFFFFPSCPSSFYSSFPPPFLLFPSFLPNAPLFSPSPSPSSCPPLRTLAPPQDNQDKVGETAPSDLWTSKPLSQRSLKRKWYFKEKVEEEKKIQVDSSVHVATSSACSITESRSLGQSEYVRSAVI